MTGAILAIITYQMKSEITLCGHIKYHPLLSCVPSILLSHLRVMLFSVYFTNEGQMTWAINQNHAIDN